MKRGEAEKFKRARELVRPRVEAEQPIKTADLEREHGISKDTFERAALAEQARQEARTDPLVNRAELSISAQQKFDAAVRQHQRKLDLQFEQRVLDEIKRRIDEIVLPHWKQRIEEAHKLYRHRRGAMDKATFNAIRRALHPDSRASISDEMLAKAFDTFMGLEKHLLDEKDSPTEIGPLPSTLAEWDKIRRKPRRGHANVTRK